MGFNVILFLFTTVSLMGVALSQDLTIQGFCSAIKSERGQAQCSEVTKGKTLTPGALKLCKKMSLSQHRIECLKALANRDVSEDLAITCAQGPVVPLKTILQCALDRSAPIEPSQTVSVPPSEGTSW